ncbi:MAG: TlyA family RNA methyltransferase [Candidatus Acidiferrales bacterium]
MRTTRNKSPRPTFQKSVKPSTRSNKKRIDLLLVERGLAPSRQRSQAMLLAGEVAVAGQLVTKAGALLATDADIEIHNKVSRFASRGGLKLEGALDDFGIAVAGKICLDAGSSTGGFTDCLLQHGATRVYAVDVNIRQLDWKLREDPRVACVKKNARYLKASDISEAVALVTLDVSFISATKVLPALISVANVRADFLILVKPQFELERRDISRGGIVRDPALHERAIARVVACSEELDLEILGTRPSRIAGAEGNQEFFLHARRRG